MILTKKKNNSKPWYTFHSNIKSNFTWNKIHVFRAHIWNDFNIINGLRIALNWGHHFWSFPLHTRVNLCNILHLHLQFDLCFNKLYVRYIYKYIELALKSGTTNILNRSFDLNYIPLMVFVANIVYFVYLRIQRLKLLNVYVA